MREFVTHGNRLSYFVVGANFLASPNLIACALRKSALIYSEMKKERRKEKEELVASNVVSILRTCGVDATENVQ